ncbi:DUF3071 domain-containing protein [Ornithinimicrobium pratense]|uniref:DUF3071 domain-containing protein n=1 Tax=Ornithinimicrobium pratense TaxID=2593973 RepID=A0A5J6V3Q7_9MICO|nr:DUF3071 domain-containing protein [Ornithinimicrobium pratense]
MTSSSAARTGSMAPSDGAAPGPLATDSRGPAGSGSKGSVVGWLMAPPGVGTVRGTGIRGLPSLARAARPPRPTQGRMAEWSTMQQLQFVELDEGGRLVVATDDGTRYAVPVDDRLRAALRPRPESASDREAPRVSLRAVQSMIRAGQSAEEVASVTGWDTDRVRRYEGPVLAEREHIIGLAQRAAVRSQGRTDGSHTLGDRVQERLQRRDVDPAGVAWEAARSTAHGPWTVQVIFSAGGRERRGAWHYDLRTRGLEALDDEARWLSEDEQALPGGLAGHPLLGTGHAEDEVAADLMATMRERRQRRSRRPSRSASHEAVGDPGQPVGHVPGQQAMPPRCFPWRTLPTTRTPWATRLRPTPAARLPSRRTRRRWPRVPSRTGPRRRARRTRARRVPTPACATRTRCPSTSSSPSTRPTASCRRRTSWAQMTQARTNCPIQH